jgi:hypothetical protein
MNFAQSCYKWRAARKRSELRGNTNRGCPLSGKHCLHTGQACVRYEPQFIVLFLTFAIPNEIRIIRLVIALPAPLLYDAMAD